MGAAPVADSSSDEDRAGGAFSAPSCPVVKAPRPHRHTLALSDGCRQCRWRAVQAVFVQIISDHVVQRNILGQKADDYGFPETLVDVDQNIHIAEATTS